MHFLVLYHNIFVSFFFHKTLFKFYARCICRIRFPLVFHGSHANLPWRGVRYTKTSPQFSISTNINLSTTLTSAVSVLWFQVRCKKLSSVPMRPLQMCPQVCWWINVEYHPDLLISCKLYNNADADCYPRSAYSCDEDS